MLKVKAFADVSDNALCGLLFWRVQYELLLPGHESQIPIQITRTDVNHKRAFIRRMFSGGIVAIPLVR